jgi:hypothetical protein
MYILYIHIHTCTYIHVYMSAVQTGYDNVPWIHSRFQIHYSVTISIRSIVYYNYYYYYYYYYLSSCHHSDEEL